MSECQPCFTSRRTWYKIIENGEHSTDECCNQNPVCQVGPQVKQWIQLNLHGEISTQHGQTEGQFEKLADVF